MIKSVQISGLLFVAAFGLSGCGPTLSRGEQLAEDVCQCQQTAGEDVSKKIGCVQKQLDLQKGIEGDVQETQKYLTRLAACPAFRG
jgi:hypothetical protein